MNPTKVRTFHRRLGISIAFFLLVQAVVGMLMSIGKLGSLDSSPTYSALYSIHAGWNPFGSIYRVVLGLATGMQGLLGVMIFLNRFHYQTRDKAISTISSSSGYVLSFATDIRPLFRASDLSAMKPNGIDLSSYDDVKKHAQEIYARLAAKEMPCDKPWSDIHMQKLKGWMQSGMEP